MQKGPSILRNTTQALEPKMDSHRLSRFRDLACEPEDATLTVQKSGR